MTAHKTQKPPKTTPTKAGPPVLNFDPQEFFHFLEGTDWSDEQKADYVTLVWNIVCEFVAMGWGVHPLQQAKESCGKTVQSRVRAPLGAAEMVDSSHSELIEEFVRRNGESAPSGGEGVSDG
ncbi:MAG: hypothetical protein RIB45_06025 [Marivibrio sp.]|uniref:hypothetical protein n=1 Tax=Marivibrio sp. TaxID=2039719 RepID=UPI0032EED905